LDSSGQIPAGDDRLRGTVLADRFRIERLLGRGGMGEVFLAYDELLHRRVALKRLQGGDDADFTARKASILKEARRASRVSDRHIAGIHDVVDLGRDLLIVMEYVEGSTLRQALPGPLPLERFWDLAGQCLEALAAAHAHGVIHRDIKPENLMLTPASEIKILDFGIAWRRVDPGISGSTASTTTTEERHAIAGSPLYMAPEAHYGGVIDERTDIFSLGVVFYELLGTQHPFAAATPEALIERKMNGRLEPLAEVNPKVPAPLAGVVERMLASDPAQRFGSCAEVAEALRAARRGDRPLPAPAPATAAMSRRRARLVPVWIGIGCVALATAVLLARPLFAPGLPRERRLAILPPITTAETSDFAAFALGSVELLGNRLATQQTQPGFQMATFADTYDRKPSTAADLGRELGANLALVPALSHRNGRLVARLDLRETARARSFGTRAIAVADDRPLAFCDSLYAAALSLLRLRATARPAIGVRGAGTLRFLLQGVGRRLAATSTDERSRAIADLENACRAEPDAAEPRAWLAAAAVGQYLATTDSAWLARGETAAREAVALDSTCADAHRQLGWVLGYRKREEESLAEFRQASLLDPADDVAWYRWGRTWQKLGHPERERDVYAEAIARRPHCWKPRQWLALWEYRQGHFDAAIPAYEAMIGRAPDLAEGYSSLGGVLLLRGDYVRAIDTLRLAARLRPTSAAYSNLGTVYFNSSRFADAIAAYNQALQFGDADYVLWCNLGDAYYYSPRGRPDLARGAYVQSVRLARERIAERARDGHSPDAGVAATLATIYPKLGRPDSARTLLALALAADSTSSQVQYHAALTHWQLGERAPAMMWLRRALTGGYPLPWVRDSPVHRDWRAEPEFQALLATGAHAAAATNSPAKGEMR